MILVTGGAGFIGSHVVDDLLARGHRVRVLDSLDPSTHPSRPGYLSDNAELIVGDLRDEFDPGGEPEIIRVDRTRWLVDGGASIDDVREQLDIDLPEGDYVTLGGFLFDAFGHIPEEGERLTHDGWELRVAEMDKRRVAKVVVQAAADTVPEEQPSVS